MSSVSNLTIRCQNCNFSHLCLPLNLTTNELDSLNSIIRRESPLHKQDELIRAGTPFTSLFAVRSGSFKSYTLSGDGEQQIIAFHLPGDIIGFNGLTGVHQSFTQALETSMVCEIPYNTFDQMTVKIPKLRGQMMDIMSQEIRQDKEIMFLLNKRTAEERVAYFLNHLSERFHARGFSATEFNLTMTRGEIGNYLGLTVETVSRLLGRFQQEGIIKVQGKFITVECLSDLEKKLGDNIPFTPSCKAS